MKYFEISLCSDSKITGVKNAGQQVQINEDGFSIEKFNKIKNFFMNRSYWEKANVVPDFEVVIESASIVNKAKLTDFMHYSHHMFGCPFMVSEKVVNLFNDFNISNHYYYNVFLKKNGDDINGYKLMHIMHYDVEVIDFKNTRFIAEFDNPENGRYYTFDSFVDYQNYEGEHTLNISEISLNSNFNDTLDLFDLRLGVVFVSERLKKAIENEDLSGVVFSDKINVVIE